MLGAIDSALQGKLYDDPSIFIFILLTIVLGGAAGYSSGKAIASTWRPGWHLVVSALVLGVGVRFLHFALFNATFLLTPVTIGGVRILLPQFYVIDTAIVMAACFLAFHRTRVRQMTSKYRWLYRPAGPFSWAPAGPEAEERLSS
jgi:NO-binding membrane sensor protein with MHYT domain